MSSIQNWPGARISGSEGTKILSHFALEADKKALTEINSLYGDHYPEFKPWMSRSKSYDRLKSLDEVERVNFLTNDSGLKILRATLTEGEPLNLKAVDPNAQENVSILLKNDPEDSRFSEYVEAYIKITEQINPSWKSRLNFLVHEINPMCSLDDETKLREDGSGLSSLYYRKAIFLSLPNLTSKSFFEFALNLSHELGHQALMVYEHFDDIVRVDQYSTSYSIIRKTHRPAIQSFHALCATVYMLEFIIISKGLLDCDKSYMNYRSEQLLEDLRVGLSEIQSISLTSLGDQIIAEFKAFAIWTQRTLNV